MKLELQSFIMSVKLPHEILVGIKVVYLFVFTCDFDYEQGKTHQDLNAWYHTLIIIEQDSQIWNLKQKLDLERSIVQILSLFIYFLLDVCIFKSWSPIILYSPLKELIVSEKQWRTKKSNNKSGNIPSVYLYFLLKYE